MAAEQVGPTLMDNVVKPSVCARYAKTTIHDNLKYYLFSKPAIDSLVDCVLVEPFATVPF